MFFLQGFYELFQVVIFFIEMISFMLYFFLLVVYKVLLIWVILIFDYGVFKEVVWIYFKVDEYIFVVIKQENEYYIDNLDEDKKCY